MKKFIIRLVRKRLGLKKGEKFKFTNQKTNDTYYFTEEAIMKIENNGHVRSSVSLNWLLDDDCEVYRMQ